MKRIKKIKATYFKFIDDKLFVLENDNSSLYVYDNEVKLIKKVGENYGGGLELVNNNVLDHSFRGINVNTFEQKNIFKNEKYYFNVMNNSYVIINKFIEEFKSEQYLVDKSNFEIIKKIDYKGSISLFTPLNNIISFFKNSIFLYKNFSLLWEKDLSEITSYTEWDNTEEQGEIREVYAFENSILVLTQVFILRIDIQTGNIIYSLRLPAGLMTLSIEGKKAYGCYGYHYMEIDIEKGKLLNFVRIETVFYKEKEYSAIMNKGTYHNGFVFHGLRLEGGQYAIGAINIMTGKREWVDLLDVFMIENIQFHQDKMFVSDTGSNLFIYQKWQ